MFRFPSWLALVGAALPIVVLIEGLFPLYLFLPPAAAIIGWNELYRLLDTSMMYGIAFGIVLGLIAIAFALVRHGRDFGGAACFGPNLF